MIISIYDRVIWVFGNVLVFFWNLICIIPPLNKVIVHCNELLSTQQWHSHGVPGGGEDYIAYASRVLCDLYYGFWDNSGDNLTASLPTLATPLLFCTDIENRDEHIKSN